ncbi:MAG: sugar phosphate isomerase/epimerase [Clostridia bacterium]|nr:sugar phosphate isomerase/epimerase [Clostridia bacterium]
MKKSIFYDHILLAARQECAEVSEIVEYAASLGYVACDVGWESADALRSVYSILQKAGLGISCVYRFIDFSNTVDIDDACMFFACLREFACDNAMVIAWGKEQKPNYTDAEFETVCANLSTFCALAKPYGVRVSVEDFDSNEAIINNTAAFKRAFALVPALFHTFDTGNYAYFSESPTAAFHAFAKRISHVHLKDRSLAPNEYCQNASVLADGKKAYSCPNGMGFVEIRECIELLSRNGYDGYLSIEHFGLEHMKDAVRQSAAYVDAVLSDVAKNI